MKYTVLPYDDSLTHGPLRYLIDKDSDISELPTDCSVGSKVIVAESGNTYLLNNQHEWKKQITSSGGESSGDSDGGAGTRVVNVVTDEVYETINLDITTRELVELINSGTVVFVKYEKTTEGNGVTSTLTDISPIRGMVHSIGGEIEDNPYYEFYMDEMNLNQLYGFWIGNVLDNRPYFYAD